jgi:hypothetical protein
MAARRRKSKKPSAGSARPLSPSPPEEFVLYLDENLCNTRAILDSLTRLAVRFERHLAHFEPGIPDETWLPLVGSKGWILLTSDKRIRLQPARKACFGNSFCSRIRVHIRQFVGTGYGRGPRTRSQQNA